MATTYRIDREQRFVFCKATGIVTNDDIFDYQRRLEVDPSFEPDFGLLFDMRQVSEFQVTSDGVRRLASRTPFGTRARRALVADRDDTFGMARMFQALLEGGGSDVRVVRHISEALSFLGLSEEPT